MRGFSSLNWTSLSKPHNPKSIARFKNFAKPDFSLYYSMDELLQEVVEEPTVTVFIRMYVMVANRKCSHALQVNRLVDSHSDFATKDTIVREDEGYAANISVITVGQDYNADAKNPLRLLFNFGEHARELITSEVALDFLTDLLGRLSNTSCGLCVYALFDCCIYRKSIQTEKKYRKNNRSLLRSSPVVVVVVVVVRKQIGATKFVTPSSKLFPWRTQMDGVWLRMATCVNGRTEEVLIPIGIGK